MGEIWAAVVALVVELIVLVWLVGVHVWEWAGALAENRGRNSAPRHEVVRHWVPRPPVQPKSSSRQVDWNSDGRGLPSSINCHRTLKYFRVQDTDADPDVVRIFLTGIKHA